MFVLIAAPPHRESPAELFLSLVVGDVDVDAVEPGLEAGLAEALHAQQALVRAAKHGQELGVKWALEEKGRTSR